MPQPEAFKTVRAAHEYILSCGWTLATGKEPSFRHTEKAVADGKLQRQKNGTFLAADVTSYANLALHKQQDGPDPEISLKEAIEREKLRKLTIENDQKAGKLVLLSEEIKRRVAVIQNMKASLLNGKATFVRSLHDCMKQRHPSSEVLNDMMLDAADLYENAVLDVFHEIYERS